MLSPLLFLIMIINLPESSNGVKFALFADDISMWKSVPNLPVLSRDVQRYRTETAKFLRDWGLQDIEQQHSRHPLFCCRSKHIPTYDVFLKINDDHDQAREDREVPRRNLRPGPHMDSSRRLHHRLMQSPAELHEHDSKIDLWSVEEHLC